MGFLKDFLSGSLPSQNPDQSRDTRSPQSPLQKTSTMSPPTSSTSPPLSAVQRARAKYEEGMRLFESGTNTAGAGKAMMEAVRLDTTFVDAWVACARVALCMHQTLKAHNQPSDSNNWRFPAERAFELDPTNPGAKFVMSLVFSNDGARYSTNGDWHKSYDAYKRCFELAPDRDVMAALQLGSKKIGRETDLAEFIVATRAAINKRAQETPDSPAARFELGSFYLAVGENESAAKELAALERLDKKMASDLRGEFKAEGVVLSTAFDVKKVGTA
jgi:tetratricopeptide (TPR) repeat protein